MIENQNLNEVKQKINEIERRIDSKFKIPVKAAINLIPFLGEVFNEIGENILIKKQNESRKVLIDLIMKDNEEITIELVKDIEFIMNFAKMVEVIDRLAKNDKIKYFANLLKNGYLYEDRINNDEFEEYLNQLKELSYREIYILINYVESMKNKRIKNIGDSLELELFYEEMKSKLGINKNEIICILERLQNKQLCIFSEGLDTGKYWCSTAYYDKFSSRILDRKL